MAEAADHLPSNLQYCKRKRSPLSRVLVAHICSPSYSGGRDEEDHNVKAAWANSYRDPILKKHITKKGCWSG
jgi:hypothetical protein